MVALLIVAATGLNSTRRLLHWVDRNWLGERTMDALARLRTDEDWTTAEALAPGQDYHWLERGAGPVLIAHALGDAARPTANTLAAARRSYAAGLRLLEVDLVLEGGELRCQHDAGEHSDMVRDGCTLPALLAALPRDAFLVLDIKSDFPTAGQQIVDLALAAGDSGRIIFQLYRPGDFALFNRWQAQTPASARLPGPILTAYLAHRRVDHVAGQVGRLGVRAFTLPLERLPALSARPAGAKMLVHPVHDCDAWSYAANMEGLYVLSALSCLSPSGGMSR